MITQRIGLYYPYIHCRDEKWLKLTALYWPQLARVVPEGYPVADSDTVAALNDGLDFLGTTRPEPAASAIAPLFLNMLREHPETLEATYGVAGGSRDSGFSVTTEPGTFWEARQSHTTRRRFGLAGLHEDEVAPELRAALVDAGLAMITERSQIARADGVRWVAMQPELAWVYKCALTEELARRGSYTPLTDQPISHGAYGWDAERIAQALLSAHRLVSPVEEKLEQAIGLMSVRLVVPENLDDVPVERIIQLRQRHRAEFDAYTDAVSTAAAHFRESLGEIEDPDARQKYLTLKVAQSFGTPLEELRKAMRGLKINTVYSSMSAKFELGTAATFVLGGISAGQSLATAGAAAFGLATLRRNAALARDAQMRTAPTAYLLRVERGLQPRQLHRRVMRGLGRLTGTSV